MNRINFSYSVLVLVVTGLAVSLTGCGQKRELDPRTQPELVRTVVKVRRPEQIPHSRALSRRACRAILVSEFPERSRAA
jgi:hypothetical protein